MQKASSWAGAWPPLSLATMGALAKSWGEVRLLDGNVDTPTTAGLLEAIGGFSPHLLVIATGFPSIDNDMATARAIKERFPRLQICAFGVFFTLLEREGFSRYPFVDLAIVGEPEETFAEVGGALLRGEPLRGVSGILYREENGIRQTPKRVFSQKLGLRHSAVDEILESAFPQVRSRHV